MRLATWAQLVVMEAASGIPFGSLAYYTPAESGGDDTTQCGSLTIGGGEMTVASCDGTMQTIKLNGGPLTQWLEVQDRLAPFVYEADGTTLVFT